MLTRKHPEHDTMSLAYQKSTMPVVFKYDAGRTELSC